MTKPNLIVFMVTDSLRYDSCYPDIENVLPHMTSCSTHFHQVRSSGCWTLPSHASMFSGLWPHEHGANAQIRKPVTNYPRLVDHLKNQGYYTLMVTTNHVVADLFGINKGFDETIKIWKHFPAKYDKRLLNLLGVVWRPRIRQKFIKSFVNFKLSSDIESVRILLKGYAPDMFSLTKKRIQELLDQGKKVFVYMNFYDTHFPYHTQDNFRLESKGFGKIPEFLQLIDIINNVHMTKNIYKPYKNSLKKIKDRQRLAFNRWSHYADSFTRWIREKAPNSTIVFGGDHGDNFGEEGWLYHFGNVTDAGTHVPLLWSSSGQSHRDDVFCAVGLKDVFNSFLYEAQAGPKSQQWHLINDPDKSLSITEAAWYDNYGATVKRFRRNQFSFNTEKFKFVFRNKKWYQLPLGHQNKDDHPPSVVFNNPIMEIPMDEKKRLEFLNTFNKYLEYEKTIPIR